MRKFVTGLITLCNSTYSQTETLTKQHEKLYILPEQIYLTQDTIFV